MSFLSLIDLLEKTNQVTDWYTLGVYLKMPSEELKDIEWRLSGKGLKRCKIELFSSWLKRYSDASWEQIALALEKCDENAAADRIRKSHFVPDDDDVDCVSRPTSQATPDVKVRLGKDKVAKFRKLEKSYAKLTLDLKISLDEKPVPLLNLGRFLIDLLDEDEVLLQATTVDQLFQLIKPHYCFLNTAILGDIIERFIGQPLKQQLDEYESQLEEFKESTSMSLLQEVGPQCSPSMEAPQLTIKLATCWQKVTIKRFQKLVEQIFEENSTALANILVKNGCICVTWFARKSAVPAMVAQALKMTDFMRLVGVLRMKVGNVNILEQQEEDESFLSSALFHATCANCVTAVEFLVILGANPNSTERRDTPVMIACWHRSIRIATLLLQAGANVNQQNEHGETAIMIACYSETPHDDLVKLLVQSGANVGLQEALMNAVRYGHTSIVRYLLDGGAPVNTQDVKGCTPLMLASTLGHSEVVRALVDYGADVNVLAKDLDVTALIAACSQQRTACVDLLLASGADPNLCSIMGTPLIAACFNFTCDQSLDPAILEKLLSAGADPNAQNVHGNTALMMAVSGYQKGVEILLNAAADVNTQSPEGYTALMLAVAYENEKAVEILLNAAADVNIQDTDGSTALHVAAEGGYMTIAKMLLASGARVTITDSSGDTPLDIATKKDHHEVCIELRTSMDSDHPATQEMTKPGQDSSQSPSTTKTTHREIFLKIASVSQYFKDLLLPDRAIKLRHSNKVQDDRATNW